jgi:hypothetical protein
MTYAKSAASSTPNPIVTGSAPARTLFEALTDALLKALLRYFGVERTLEILVELDSERP